MKTADLVADYRTDALVALARGWGSRHAGGEDFWHTDSTGYIRKAAYSPSTNPAQWAELQEQFKIDTFFNIDKWFAKAPKANACCAVGIGLAICKAVIAAKWGDEIDDEIWEKVK